LGELGGKVRVHKSEKFGNHVEVRFGAKPRGPKPVLLLGHMDTVHPIGTISKMPCRVAKGRVMGPGVLDMKAGIALALHVIEALIAWNGGKLPRPVTIFLVSDEEVGSQSSRAITERLAQESAAVLVLEPAAGSSGAVKTSRKGVGEYRLRVEGTAAHSGLDFGKGQSAVVELARQILEITKFVDPQRGITLNVGKISGGTRANVVPAEALAVTDVRVTSRDQAAEVQEKLTALKPFNPNCRISITGAINRPPMERTNGVASLYAKAVEVAKQLGWELQEASVGGGSDGNFTAALGIPTLDGLGAIGEGAHAAHESVVISELPRRAALLAGLIASI
jgi:glutamate carboxypeptidase